MSLIDRSEGQPIRSVAYFEPVLAEVRKEAFPSSHWQHLEFNLKRCERYWRAGVPSRIWNRQRRPRDPLRRRPTARQRERRDKLMKTNPPIEKRVPVDGGHPGSHPRQRQHRFAPKVIPFTEIRKMGMDRLLQHREAPFVAGRQGGGRVGGGCQPAPRLPPAGVPRVLALRSLGGARREAGAGGTGRPRGRLARLPRRSRKSGARSARPPADGARCARSRSLLPTGGIESSTCAVARGCGGTERSEGPEVPFQNWHRQTRRDGPGSPLSGAAVEDKNETG